MAARVERAAQRADRSGIGRAEGGVFRLELIFADAAADRRLVRPSAARLAGDVVLAVGRIGDDRRGDERHGERDEGSERLHRGAEEAGEGERRREARQQHGADAHRVDVVEMRPLELDMRRAEAERLVDREIGDDGADPGGGDRRIEPEDLLERRIYPELDQQQRDGDVEHQPDDAAGMAVRQAREEVRPGDRAGIGIRHVDLELRDDDEEPGERRRHARRRDHVLEGHRIHLGRLRGIVEGDAVLMREIGQERARQQLQRAEHDPARPGREQRGPAPEPVARALRRQEAEEVDLLADLRNQRQHDRGGGAEQHEVEAGGAALRSADEAGPSLERIRAIGRDEDEGQDVQHHPDRLRPELKAADEGDAVRHQRDDHQGANDVADGERHAEAFLQRHRHDDGFDGEEDEGEGGVDQRGDGRADIAEPGAAGQQVDVDAVFRRVIADRQAGGEDQQPHRQNRRHGVGEAAAQRDGAADRLEREKRDRAEGGVGDPQR